MSKDKDYILDEIKKNYIFNGKSKFYRVYEVFNKSCNDFHDNNISCLPDPTTSWEKSSEVIDLLKDLYSNLHRIYATLTGTNNVYVDDIKREDYKLCFTSLKYWLYDQIITKELEETKIVEIFTGWKSYIKGKVENPTSNYCEFNKLTLDEIKKLKNIYALYTVLYDNDKFETCNKNTCKYLDYVGKGLDELISSINSCSSNPNMTNYCKELKEFLDLCKENNEDAGISIYEENTRSNADRDGKHLLTSQKYNDQPLYIYIKDENLLNFVKTSDFLSNKSTTIAATSVVGSAIGLSSIFYYFYKFTPFGSTLRKGKGKNVVDIDERANDSLLYTPDTEQIPFKNREYKVAYHTFSDT
ncbi:PIR protein [Plasmodium vivax]|uniref:VIR protein n=1 Tax=Plasmodium vivax TaxID=5855 RepID=A0A565A519_PLAVI|nr:PIR protein [Plasmodium vivax]